MNTFQTIKKIMTTEKTSLTEEINNCYGLIVDMKAKKQHIKQALETIYGVKVLRVKTSILPGKVKRAGKRIKKTSKKKKAYVTLAEGNSLSSFRDV